LPCRTYAGTIAERQGVGRLAGLRVGPGLGDGERGDETLRAVTADVAFRKGAAKSKSSGRCRATHARHWRRIERAPAKVWAACAASTSSFASRE